jgi:hypothetical protein
LAWTDIVNGKAESKDDLINTRFKISVKMKMSDYERQVLEQDIQRYSQVPDAMSNPSITLKDAMMLRNIDDFKLATWYLTKTYEKNRRDAAKEKQVDSDANLKSQRQTALDSDEREKRLQDEKLEHDKDLEDYRATKQKELKVLDIVGMVASKGLPLPPFIEALTKKLYPNIAIPLDAENKNMSETIQANALQEQMENEAAAQQNPQEENQEQGQPPMQQQGQQGMMQPQQQQMMQ